MCCTMGMEQKKRFLLWGGGGEAREEFPFLSRQSHKTGISSASSYWGGRDLGANRASRLRLMF